MYCKICNKEVSQNHLRYAHSMSSKEYYDKYIKSDDYDGVCKICGKETTFRSIKDGYNKFCSYKCAGKSAHGVTVPKNYSDGFGNTFDSLSDLCKYHNISIATLSTRLHSGWNITDAIIMPNQHKIAVEYKGVKYKSVKEACNKLDLDYAFISEMIRNGVKFKDAINTPKVYQRGVFYKNTQYKTLTEFCNKFGLNFKKMWNFLYKGYSLEESIILQGVAPNISSYPEKLISHYLADKKIEFYKNCSVKQIIRENNLTDNNTSTKLYFDFYFKLNNKMYCIEYDGELHFSKKALHGYLSRKGHRNFSASEIDDIFIKYRNRDLIKNKFCKKHKIHLLRIHYTQLSEINTLINNFISSQYSNRFNLKFSNKQYYEEV